MNKPDNQEERDFEIQSSPKGNRIKRCKVVALFLLGVLTGGPLAHYLIGRKFTLTCSRFSIYRLSMVKSGETTPLTTVFYSKNSVVTALKDFFAFNVMK